LDDHRHQQTGADADSKKPSEPLAANSLWEGVKSLVLAFALFLVLRSFVIQNFVITSGSMEETLLVGDFLMVDRVGLGSRIPFTSVSIPGYSEPRRNDVEILMPVVHEAIDTEETRVDHEKGWNGCLENLEALFAAPA